MASLFGTPLGQLGQGWWHQAGGSAFYPPNNPGATSSGFGQSGRDTGLMAGDAGQPVSDTSISGYGQPASPGAGADIFGQPANSPASGGGVSATGPFMQNDTAPTVGTPSTGMATTDTPVGGPSSQGLARAPISGPPLGYGQPSRMMWGGSNASGFGGLGTRGQGPAAPFWARLNNIGGH